VLLTNTLQPSQSLILSIAQKWLDEETKEDLLARQTYMAENCPPAQMSGDQATLMVNPLEAP